jgi:hypothetical protein
MFCFDVYAVLWPYLISRADITPYAQRHFDSEVCEDLAVSEFLKQGANEAMAARSLSDHLQLYFTGMY